MNSHAARPISPDLDIARIDAFLRGRISGLSGTPRFAPIAGGYSSTNLYPSPRTVRM